MWSIWIMEAWRQGMIFYCVNCFDLVCNGGNRSQQVGLWLEYVGNEE